MCGGGGNHVIKRTVADAESVKIFRRCVNMCELLCGQTESLCEPMAYFQCVWGWRWEEFTEMEM